MADVRALSLWQPWASLVAVGAKRIETRSWSMKYRGRLLIHAAKRRPDVPHRLGGYGVGHHRLRYADHVDEGYTLAGPGRVLADGVTEHDTWPLPLSAVVASCLVVDCVPITDACSTDMTAPAHICSSGATLLYHRPDTDTFPDGNTERDVTDQLPFGDFTPGRWAWLLDDVNPTSERCPRCWGDRWLWHDPDGESGDGCPTCHVAGEVGGRGACEPVPMRGRQGLWTPTW